ncbi:hypothetical protein WA026_001930 [Henosepilachna vigintioctopunctata]|uniref:Uncharacterized protein n=1 Tax=Henosepilachna vigintioctopunctata TaxID=420089 RepID=A0AAW1UUS3_9CUCU
MFVYSNIPQHSKRQMGEMKEYQEKLLLDFPDEERSSISRIPATNVPEDLQLFEKLCRKKYFLGENHIEKII